MKENVVVDVKYVYCCFPNLFDDTRNECDRPKEINYLSYAKMFRNDAAAVKFVRESVDNLGYRS